MNDEMTKLMRVIISGIPTKPMPLNQIYTDFISGYGPTEEEFKDLCSGDTEDTISPSYGNDRIKFVILEDTILFLYRSNLV